QLVERHAPVFRIGGRRRLDRRPELDDALHRAADGFMLRRRLARGADAAPSLIRQERLVHRLEDRRRGTEGKVERHALEAQLGVAMALLEEAPHLSEQLWRCALKGKDRLLLVADCENGPSA